MIDIKAHRQEFVSLVDHLKEEYNGVRTGRAHAGLVEHIMVDSYGAPTPIKHCATISIPDQRTILISPWDASLLKEIEKGIVNSNLGFNPMNDGAAIRITVPSLTEENRKQMAKTIRQKQEQARVAVRLLRDKIRDEIQKAEKNNEITEDDRFSLQKELDDISKEYVGMVDAVADEKEEEIMNI